MYHPITGEPTVHLSQRERQQIAEKQQAQYEREAGAAAQQQAPSSGGAADIRGWIERANAGILPNEAKRTLLTHCDGKGAANFHAEFEMIVMSRQFPAWWVDMELPMKSFLKLRKVWINDVNSRAVDQAGVVNPAEYKANEKRALSPLSTRGPSASKLFG